MSQLTLSSEPIPLAAPDGTVYAYACPRCRQVPTPGHYMCRITDEQVAQVAEGFKRKADVCCRCRRCGTDITSVTFGYCSACEPIEKAEQDDRDRAFLERDERRAAELERRLGASKDRAAAERLVDAMREISEACWCAGWLSGLEFSLWRMVTAEPNGARFGQGDVPAEDVTKLRQLHEACGGWWHWDDQFCGEMFVSTEEWLRLAREHWALGGPADTHAPGM